MRRSAVVVQVVLVCLGLAACGGAAGATVTATSAGAATGTASEGISLSASPTPTGSPAGEAVAGPTPLPESALHPIGGLTYRSFPTGDALPASLTAGARAAPGVFEGYIGRKAVESGSDLVIATVQLFRFSPGLSKAELVEYQGTLVEGFTAGARTTKETIAGHPATVAATVRQQALSVIAVPYGNDLVLFTSASLKALRRAVTLYFA